MKRYFKFLLRKLVSAELRGFAIKSPWYLCDFTGDCGLPLTTLRQIASLFLISKTNMRVFKHALSVVQDESADIE